MVGTPPAFRLALSGSGWGFFFGCLASWLQAAGLAGLAGAAGCGSGSDSPSSADAAGEFADAAPAEAFEETPSFIHVLERSSGFDDSVFQAQVIGRFRETALVAYREVDRAGECRVLRAEPGFCDPPCDGYCEMPGICHPYAPLQSAGALAFAGLTAPLTLGSAGSVLYDWSQNAPLTARGSPVSVQAAGDDLAAFSLSTRATPPVLLDGPTSWQLAAGAEFEFTWAPATDGARVRLTLNSDTGHGAFHPAVLECDAPDSGRLSIPAALIDQFVDPANWSCGRCAASSLRRYHRATSDVGGVRVELLVANEVFLDVRPAN